MRTNSLETLRRPLHPLDEYNEEKTRVANFEPEIDEKFIQLACGKTEVPDELEIDKMIEFLPKAFFDILEREEIIEKFKKGIKTLFHECLYERSLVTDESRTRLQERQENIATLNVRSQAHIMDFAKALSEGKETPTTIPNELFPIEERGLKHNEI